MQPKHENNIIIIFFLCVKNPNPVNFWNCWQAWLKLKQIMNHEINKNDQNSSSRTTAIYFFLTKIIPFSWKYITNKNIVDPPLHNLMSHSLTHMRSKNLTHDQIGSLWYPKLPTLHFNFNFKLSLFRERERESESLVYNDGPRSHTGQKMLIFKTKSPPSSQQ